MRVRLPHSNGLFLSQKGTQFTDMRASVPDGKRFCPGSRVPESRIEGNVPHLRAKFTHFVGFLPIVIIAVVTIASLAGIHFRVVYVGQVTLSLFAIFWGFMTVLTFSKPGRFNVDVRIALDWGFFFYLLAFIASAIAGIISVRWSERMQQRDLVKSLQGT